VARERFSWAVTACGFYGAAEFSRDLDLLIPADAANLASLKRALDALDAEAIAVPAMEEGHLLRGHAVHFRCHREDVAGLRIDLKSSLRDVAGFEELWARRTSVAGGNRSYAPRVGRRRGRFAPGCSSRPVGAAG